MAYNERIDDDAIPALLILRKLNYLSLLDTSVSMAGVRRLALEVDESQRYIEVEGTARRIDGVGIFRCQSSQA